MELLNILVGEQNFQTVTELVEQVAISPRMIHGDLQDINPLQLLHGAKLIKEPNIGTRLHYAQKQREAIYRQLQKNRFETFVPLEKGGDLYAILHILLTYRDAIHMEDLANALYRSRSSLTTVLEEVEKLTGSYDCRLRKHSNYGLSLEGHKEDIRNPSYRFVDTLPTQGYQHNDLNVRLPGALCKKMKVVFDVQMIWMVIPIVKSSEASLNTHYYDYDFGVPILKCCTLFTRYQVDKSVQEQTIISTDLQEYCVATIIKLKMEQIFHVSLPEEEIYYLERVILSTRK